MFRILVVQGFGVCALLVLGNAFRWWSELTAARAGVHEKLLRSPGESLRRSIEQLTEYLIYSVAVFLLVPMLFAWQAPILTNLWAGTLLVALMFLCAVPGLVVIRLYRRYALALRGQRAVGEELNQLMLDGCHVFHDYPAGKDWNIDHIVVAPSGVYAIETRTRERTRVTDEESANEVIFDGSTLRFPDRAIPEPINEALRAAQELSHQLSSGLGETITVCGILTLPGWCIRDRGTSSLIVVNAKDIWNRIVTVAPPKLSSDQIKRISYFLQQKCRDVEI